jgi:WD40-like Beta Propeller Repeat
MELTGTGGAFAPFFSPDGQWVAFFSQGKLKKISVEGGTPVVLCDAADGRGGSWGEDGNIIASLNFNDGILSQIPAAGGTPTPVTEVAPGELGQRFPQILPGGGAVLFTVGTGAEANIEAVSLADHRRKILHRGGTFGRYLPSGHLVYVTQATLFAMPFDVKALEVRGTPVPVLEGVAAASGAAQFDFSRTRNLVYRNALSEEQLATLQWIDSAGKMQRYWQNRAYIRLHAFLRMVSV